jgi:hypothetical protein
VGSVLVIENGHEQSDQDRKAGLGADHACHGTCFQLTAELGALSLPLLDRSKYQRRDTSAHSRTVRGELRPPIISA